MNDKPVLPKSPESMALFDLTKRIQRDAAATFKATDDAISASRKLLDKRDVRLVIRAKRRLKLLRSIRPRYPVVRRFRECAGPLKGLPALLDLLEQRSLVVHGSERVPNKSLAEWIKEVESDPPKENTVPEQRAQDQPPDPKPLEGEGNAQPACEEGGARTDLPA
jgi:hypothetical protein